MAAKDHKINLLPQEEFNNSTLGKLLAWLLSFFRVAVIITELIVMVAFLSRFWLDARNSDLNEAIKQRQFRISSLSQVEKRFNELKERLQIFSTLAKTDVSVPTELKTLASNLPPGINITSIVHTDNKGTKIQGVSPAESGVIQLVSNLKAVENIENVNLLSIQSSSDKGGLLAFTISYSPKKNT